MTAFDTHERTVRVNPATVQIVAASCAARKDAHGLGFCAIGFAADPSFFARAVAKSESVCGCALQGSGRYAENNSTTTPYPSGDVDDDQVIAAAVAARADLIVLGDRKHLLPLGSHQGIDIVDAAEAVRRIASG